MIEANLTLDDVGNLNFQVETCPEPEIRLLDIELFSGAGGLCLGLRNAGIVIDRLYERNDHACATLRKNQKRGSRGTETVTCIDVRTVDWTRLSGRVRLLAAGPPCQPFSLAGCHAGELDHRNEFPSTLAAVRRLDPAVVLIENVQGLTRPSFRPYFEYLLRQLAYPSVTPPGAADWRSHNAELQAVERRNAPEYAVRWGSLNAADYGVAQLRKRTVIIATRSAFPVVELPTPTHSREALLTDQQSGTYWRRHGIKPPPTSLMRSRRPLPCDGLQPWRTLRDALEGLVKPAPAEGDALQHWIIPGARLYRGHMGSFLDWPAKTIKAGVHGVAGGENIVHLDDGTFRYLTLREMARVQGFPDEYAFHGPRSRIIAQIGNAVPCGLAEALGRPIAAMFASVPVLVAKEERYASFAM